MKNLNADGCTMEDSMEMAECFNAYFSTIVDKLRDGLHQIMFDFSKLSNFVKSHKDPNVIFSVPTITSVEVNKIILPISPDKAAGIDKTAARLLRLVAPPVAPSIAKLINHSFCTGTFPSCWKIAKVTPLYKNGAHVIRVTNVPSQCYLSCPKSLSVTCTIRYTLFSAIITCFFFFQGSLVFTKTIVLKLPLLR